MRTLNKLLACTMALAGPLSLWAQTESEPNDAFNQANAITLGTAMNGDIGGAPCASGTSEDYFILNLAQDGKLNINTHAANSGASGSGLRIYVYNAGGGQIGYFDHDTGPNGVPISVGSSMTCLNKGIYYFRPWRLNGGVCYTYALTVTRTAPVYSDDVEPNNEFATALPLAHNTFTQGHVNFSHYGDNDDRFSLTTPAEGTITVTLIAENADVSSGSVRAYLYNSAGGQIDYFDSPAGALGDDDTTMASFTCYGLGAYYLRIQSISGCGISYKMKYAITGAVYGNDLEPNNEFSQAAANPLLAPNTFTEGHVNFSHYGDNDDRYKISTTGGGTLRLTAIAERVPAAAGALRIYVYNSNGGQIDYYDPSVGGSNDDDTTTALFDCYGQGDYYLRVASINGCGISYKLKYELLPAVYGSDVEPNNDFSQAAANPLLAPNTFTQGHVNFNHYGDNDDYYKISTPAEGTLRLTTIAERVPTAQGALRIYVYNSGGGQINYYDPAAGGSNDDDTTIALFDCYGQGDYYLRVASINGCGISYKLKYELLPAVYGNDAEPNNDFNQAAANPLLAHNTFTEGHVNFNHYGDNDDRYYILTPGDGTLRITTIAERVPTAAGAVRVYVYNNGGGQIAYYDATAGGGNDDDTTSVDLDCYGQGNYYLRVVSINGCGISYRLKYEVLAPLYGNDPEPNNSFAEAIAVNPDSSNANGHLNFAHTGNNDDYAKVALPAAGNISFDLSAENAGGGAIRVYLYNEGGGQLAYQDVPVGSGHIPVQTAVAFNGLAAGTYYVRFTSISGCGISYRLNCNDADGDGACNYFDLCPGGPEPGTACDDGNANTTGDVIDASCNCVGSPVSCDDDDPCTQDTWNGSTCVHTVLDADNDGTCDADDGCPNDGAKTSPGVCGCGNPDVPTTWFADADGDGLGDPNDSQPGYLCDQPVGYVANASDHCPAVEGTVGSACDDGDPNTTGDALDGSCNCVGSPVSCDDGDPCTLDTWDGMQCIHTFLDADGDLTCDAEDGCVNDPDKTAPGACGCDVADVATTWYADTDGDGLGDPSDSQPGFTCNPPAGYVADNSDLCPAASGTVGSACDDGNPNTTGDALDANCNCNGTPTGCMEETIVLTFTLDAFGGQTTWELRTAPGNSVVATGGPYADGTPGTVITETICVPAACYRFGVHDANGDGMGQGGYVVSDGQGNRIIDANGEFGALSYMGTRFCLPVGPVQLMPASCDRTDLTLNDQLVTTTVAGATAYQFAFFDPHGSYQEVFTRMENMIGPAPNADFPLGLPVNVRVRANVSGTWTPYGPACRLTVSTIPAMQTGVAETAGKVAAELHVWPNPNDGRSVHVAISGLQAQERHITVDVQDMYGQQVFSRAFANPGDRFDATLQLPGGIATGVYFVAVTVDDARTVQRLTIMK
ncbi:MAG: T9SS type A sorting domain-containing protein [Flavobacteriales bacterium]|nr:T9SS type A sorting domain-containing protein [Flavobacteriales bacterium]